MNDQHNAACPGIADILDDYHKINTAFQIEQIVRYQYVYLVMGCFKVKQTPCVAIKHIWKTVGSFLEYLWYDRTTKKKKALKSLTNHPTLKSLATCCRFSWYWLCCLIHKEKKVKTHLHPGFQGHETMWWSLVYPVTELRDFNSGISKDG